MTSEPAPEVTNTSQPKPYHETMPKVELVPNTRVFVKLSSISNSNVPLQAEFLGTSHYEFLILRLPSIPGLIKKLLPQTLVQVNYQSQGAASMFTSEIINYSVKPALLLYTSYPDRLRIMETRRHKRISCALPTALATPYGEGVALMKDVSKGGCCLVLEMTGQAAMRQLAVGDRIVIQVAFSPAKEAQRGIGVVRNIDNTGSRLTLGVTFDGNSKDFVEELGEYLEMMKLIAE